MADNSPQSPGRRKALKALGVGITAPTLIGTTKAAPSRREIIVSRKEDKILDTEMVPKDWYQQFQAAKRDLSSLENEVSAQSIKSCGLVKSERSFGGKPGVDIEVEVKKETSPEAVVPSAVGTTPIQVRDTEESALTSCEFSAGHAPYMPGGVQITNPVDGQDGYVHQGTAGARAIGGVGNDNYHVTCAHIFDSCNNDPTGDTEVLTHDGQDIGQVVEYHQNHDWAVVNHYATTNYEPDIESAGGTVGQVFGHVTEDGLASLMSSGDQVVEKQGIMTDHQQNGTISSIHTSSDPSCVDMSNSGVRVSLDQTNGDSGGPIFRKNDGNLEMIGIASIGKGNSGSDHSCSENTLYNKAEGIAAYAFLQDTSTVTEFF